jgi:hypothetical protein
LTDEQRRDATQIRDFTTGGKPFGALGPPPLVERSAALSRPEDREPRICGEWARRNLAPRRDPHGDGVLPDAKRSTMNVETGSHSATMLRLSPHSPERSSVHATSAALRAPGPQTVLHPRPPVPSASSLPRPTIAPYKPRATGREPKRDKFRPMWTGVTGS